MTDHDPKSVAPVPSPAEERARVSLVAQLSEFFSMNARLMEARRGDFANSDPGFREWELGLLALKDGEQLGNSAAGRDTALLLYFSAIQLLSSALLQRRGLASKDMTPVEAWSLVTRQLPDLKLGTPSGIPAALTSEQGIVRLAAVPHEERERTLVELKSIARRLAEPLAEDATRVERVLWVRRFRRAPIALLLLWGLVTAVVAVTTRPNLALHRPVTLTNRGSELDVDPSHVVDGDELNLGFHTTALANSTLTIDLGTVKQLDRVEIFNRADCCQDRVVPLKIQLSTDGATYKTVARLTHRFQEWTEALPRGTTARFVRLVHQNAEFFHLAEVKVY